MHAARIMRNPTLIQIKRTLAALTLIGALSLNAALFPALAADSKTSPPPVKIAVFDFKLDDVSAAALLPGASIDTAAIMEKVSSAARRELMQSGRYTVIDVSKADARLVQQETLRNCDGCEAGIAAQLGAEQFFVGVVRRVSMTDYYMMIQISDCRTGKVLIQEAANFAGGDDGWARGAAMLIKHQVLASP
jgi:hypothetical protein